MIHEHDLPYKTLLGSAHKIKKNYTFFYFVACSLTPSTFFQEPRRPLGTPAAFIVFPVLHIQSWKDGETKGYGSNASTWSFILTA